MTCADDARSAAKRQLDDLTDNAFSSALPDGFVLAFDTDLHYLATGVTGRPDVGALSEIVAGQTLVDAHPAGLVDILEPLYREVLAGRPSSTEMSFGHATFQVRTSPLRGDDDGIIAGLCFIQQTSRPGPAEATGIIDQHLQQSESVFDRQLRRTVELVGRTGFWHMDVATGRMTWSTGVYALWGIDAESFHGDYAAVSSIIHPEDMPAVNDAVLGCRESGTPMSVRFRITRVDDGAQRWIQALGEAVWADGHIVWVGGAVTDITDQVQAELDAVSAASFQRAIFTASPDYITVYDFASQTSVWSNRLVYEALGYSKADIENWSKVDRSKLTSRIGAKLLVDEDYPRLESALADVHHAQDDRVFHIEYRVHHRDGSLRWFSQNMAPLTRDGNGRVGRMVAISRDITDAKLSEAALQESESRFRQLADNVEVGFALRSWDDPPEYLYVNPGFERIFGYNPITSPGQTKDPAELIHPDDLDHFLEHYWTPAQQGSPARAEYRIIRPDGQERWLRSTLSPVRDHIGALRRTASTTEDITAVRQAAAALISAQTAEQANAAKNEFLSRMSHELRTPLNAVMGFAQLLQLDQLTQDQHSAVRHIIRGGRHLVGLIDDVLDISKIEGDRLDMSLEMVPVSRLLTETVELMSPQADAAGVTLSCRTDDAGTRSVRADHRRLRQVVLNLLSNAIKYNRAGGRVDISCRLSSPDQLDIVVSDTGRGIRTEDLPRLFVPFDRLDAATTGIDGTGVGLALSQRLMVHMGGSLSATSTFGMGSVFTAALPVGADLPPDGDTTDPAESFDQSAIPFQADDGPVQHRTVLYIEDNSSNIALMERVIARRKGWNLLVAGHGALGIELAESASPDLVLLDLHLPDMNGIDVLRGLRTTRAVHQMDIVVVSADANPHQMTRLLEAGARDYLTKPLNVDKILAQLDSIEQDDSPA